MYGDIYSMKYMGKQLIRTYICLVVENSAARNLTILNHKLCIYVADRASKTELLMLVSDFKVKCRLKNTQRHFHPWNPLNKDA